MGLSSIHILLWSNWDRPCSLFPPYLSTLECYQLNSGMKALFIPAINKVLGYWLKGSSALANKPPTMQIFPHSKFGINRTAGLKVMAKKFVCGQNNFLAITSKPAVQLIPNFEYGKICMFLSLFANAILPWSQKLGTLFTVGIKRAFMPLFNW